MAFKIVASSNFAFTMRTTSFCQGSQWDCDNLLSRAGNKSRKKDDPQDDQGGS